jgi:RNA polymerase sigma factor (sigma-70 family)
MMGSVRDDPTVVALVERARDGDQAAWDEIVERYAPLVWSVCQRYRLSPADVDDVGAIVWLRLVERLDSIREPAALPGWLATTARRECLNLLRIRDRYTEFDDNQHDDTAPAADHRLLEQERHIALRAAFVELSQACQQLLSLLFHDPPTPYATISATMGLPVGGIGPTRQRCLERLRASAPMAAHLDNATEGR